MSQKKNKTLNLVATAVIACVVLVILVLRDKDSKQPNMQLPPSSDKSSPAQNKTAATPIENKQGDPSQISPSPVADDLSRITKDKPNFSRPALPSELPPEMKQQLNNPPPELPEDLKAQLKSPPPELPEDLKRQLNGPPPELPPDLKAQLDAPPPELPDDIKRALAIPPRVVSLDEVNNPAALNNPPPPDTKENSEPKH